DTADSGYEWNENEIRSDLNRTYRLILQDDYSVPPDLLDRVRLLPFVEDARETVVGEAHLPDVEFASAASLATRSIADLIYLPYAKAITKGSPKINVAVLDTGVNLNHRELTGKIGKRYDFVDLDGLDTRDFVGKIKGLDDVPEDEVGHGTH